jgi:hypothetical protein
MCRNTLTENESSFMENIPHTPPEPLGTAPNLVYLSTPREEGLQRSRLAHLASPSTQAGRLRSGYTRVRISHCGTGYWTFIFLLVFSIIRLSRLAQWPCYLVLSHGDTRQRCLNAGCNSMNPFAPYEGTGVVGMLHPGAGTKAAPCVGLTETRHTRGEWHSRFLGMLLVVLPRVLATNRNS